MDTKSYNRIPFTVEAVEVNFENVDAVAAWCGGEVDKVKAKAMGTEMVVPAVKIKGYGENRNKFFTAAVGFFIVKFDNKYRVYKPAAFHATFEAVVKPTPIDEALSKIANEAIDEVLRAVVADDNFLES